MADLQHNTMTHAQVHEPKHITINNTSATGKVITNSSTVSGESEYRYLKETDIDEVIDYITIRQESGTDTRQMYWPVPYSGTILSWIAVLESTFATGGNTYELQIGGVTVTGTPITIAVATLEAAQFTATASGANTFTPGQNVMVVPTAVANTDATATVRFVIKIQRA